MSITNTSLIDLQRTGFPLERIKEHGIGAIAGITLSLLVGTGTVLSNSNPLLGQDKSTTTTVAVQYNSFPIVEIVKIQSSYEQIEQLKKSMGFNILELAAILRVSRPTVYDWIESKKMEIRRKNQERLNSIYEISEAWKAKNVGCLGSYLHKPIGVSSSSLFDLLKNSKLDASHIHRYLDNVAQVILKKQKEDEAHEALLKKHGFEPISKEDMEDRLNDIHFLD